MTSPPSFHSQDGVVLRDNAPPSFHRQDGVVLRDNAPPSFHKQHAIVKHLYEINKADLVKQAKYYNISEHEQSDILNKTFNGEHDKYGYSYMAGKVQQEELFNKYIKEMKNKKQKSGGKKKSKSKKKSKKKKGNAV